MMVLVVNQQRHKYHILDYPSTPAVNFGSGELGKVFQTQPAIDFLFGTNAIKGLPMSGEALIDASAWIVGQKIMVGGCERTICGYFGCGQYHFAIGFHSVDQIIYGNTTRTVNGSTLMKKGPRLAAI